MFGRNNLYFLSWIFCVFICYNVVVSDSVNPGIIIKNVDRSIDITTQLVEISSKLTIENNNKVGVNSFLFTIEPQFKNNVAFIQAIDSSKTNLKVTETKVQGNENVFWKIDLKEALLPGKTTTVEVECILSKALTPYPNQISQKEKQLVQFKDNHYFYSPYKVVKQTTTINLGTRNAESYTKLNPVSQTDTILTYGPYQDQAPFAVDPMLIHYENNSPFLTVTHLERTIEVSHWGMISVEEVVDLVHTGATLKGPFSRYEYQRETQSGVSSVKSFKTVLPAAATDAYYRDEIGNISTSHMRVLSDSVELDLRPRFPLFGGWKTHYILGYNVPSYEYLYNSGDEYKLKMRLIDHVFDDMIIDEVVIKIILPEGAHDIQLSTPYSVQRLEDSLHFTYLDTKGRPVISIKKNNLVENHIQDFELSYTFPRILMLQEPLLVIFAFYLLFLLVVIYVRLDLSISKDESTENRMRVSGICDKIFTHQDKRAATYNHLDDLLSKLKSNKDVNSFLAAVKTVTHDYKAETAHIAELVAKLKPDSPEIADKVSELQKLDKSLKDLYVAQQSLYVDKLITNKIARGQFVDAENSLNKKKEELVEKINNILKNLH